MSRYDNKTKAKQIEGEINRLKAIFEPLDEDKKKICQGLIEEAAFMRSTLFDLKKDINEDGVIDEMPQGDYKILRQHPSLQAYNATIKNYTNVFTKLLALLPEQMAKKIESDEFDNLLKDRD